MTRFLMRSFIAILINAITLYIVAHLFNSFFIESFGVALLAGIIISLFNFTIKPLLIFFTLPATIITLGLFLFVINAFILMLTQSMMGDLFVIDGFGIALIASVFIAFINTVLTKITNH